MAVFPDDVRIEMEFSTDVWTDIHADVLIDKKIICPFEGIMGYGPLDRVAGPGQMIFYLDNGTTNSAGLNGYYTPGHTNARSGFAAGTNVRLVIDWQIAHVRFYGRIPENGIFPTFDKFGERVTQVIVDDWMAQAADHELKLLEFAQNKDPGQVMDLILANMPIQPKGTSYGTFSSTYPYVFDTVQDNTRALSEIMKIVISEPSFAYIRRDRANGETLVVEGRHDRETVTIDSLPKSKETSGRLLLADGTNLLLADGYKLVLSEVESCSFDNVMVDMLPMAHGKHLTNRVEAISYPRELDTDATLFSLQEPFSLSAGEEKSNYRCVYRHPTKKYARVTGRDMVSPYTTDYYAANASSDAGGADLTSDLTATPTYGTEAVEFYLKNNGASLLWVTQLDAVGTGTYLDDPVRTVFVDSDSQALYGVKSLKFDMPYQPSPSTGEAIGILTLQAEKEPRNTPEIFWYCANTNSHNMSAFLNLRVGDRFEAIEDQLGINEDFFVQGMKWMIGRNNMIYFGIVPKEAGTVVYWRAGQVGASEAGETTIAGW